jgi:hypothetical protein
MTVPGEISTALDTGPEVSLTPLRFAPGCHRSERGHRPDMDIPGRMSPGTSYCPVRTPPNDQTRAAGVLRGRGPPVVAVDPREASLAWMTSRSPGGATTSSPITSYSPGPRQIAATIPGYASNARRDSSKMGSPGLHERGTRRFPLRPAWPARGGRRRPPRPRPRHRPDGKPPTPRRSGPRSRQPLRSRPGRSTHGPQTVPAEVLDRRGYPAIGQGHVNDLSGAVSVLVPGRVVTILYLLPPRHLLSGHVREPCLHSPAMLRPVGDHRLEEDEPTGSHQGRPGLTRLRHRIHRIDDDRQADGQVGRGDLLGDHVADDPDLASDGETGSDDGGLDGVDPQVGRSERPRQPTGEGRLPGAGKAGQDHEERLSHGWNLPTGRPGQARPGQDRARCPAHRCATRGRVPRDLSTPRRCHGW